jgi:HlyD family secretion protein
VTNGQIVASLNPDDLNKRLDELDVQLDEKKAQLDTRTTELEIQVIDNAVALKLAKQEVTRAALRIEQFLAGDRPLARRAKALKLQETQTNIASNKKRHEDLKGLLAEGFITEDEVEEAWQNIEIENINLESAEIELEILEKYDLPLQLTDVDNAVAQAATDKEKTLMLNRTNLRTRQRAVANASREVERVELEITKLKEERIQYEIRAPAEGVVQYGDPARPWRQATLTIGSTIHRGQLLMTIPDLSELQAEINVPESGIRRIAEGQRAVITIDALSGRTFQGTVRTVAEAANAVHWRSADVKEFKVTLDMEQPAGLKPGFSCRAEIVTKELEQALQVPIQAVFREGSTHHVYVTRGAHPERRDVEIGEASTAHVQITGGLEAGDTVFLADPKVTDASS